MHLGLSKKERDELRADLAAAEPYEDEAPGFHIFGRSILEEFKTKRPSDHLERQKATAAQKLLEQDQREKKAAGLPLEPESTPASERRARQQEERTYGKE